MTETMRELKDRAMTWPEPYRAEARRAMGDAHIELSICPPKFYRPIIEDLRTHLLAIDAAMKEGKP